MEDLIKDIHQLEFLSKELDPSKDNRLLLQIPIMHYLDDFLDNLPNMKAYEGHLYKRNAKDDFFEIDGEKKTPKSILDFIHARVDQPGLNPASAGHLGYIPGGGIYAAALGDFIAAITNRYAGVFYASPGAVRLENALINWVGQLLGYNDTCSGNLTSGGSMANLIALSTARSAFNIKGKNLDKTVIYLSKQTHHSIKKALKIIGLEECIVRYVKVDEYYRMQSKDLLSLLTKDKANGFKPFLIVANAGSTDTGAVDPLTEIGAIAKIFSLWFHVDAAYGGFFLLTKQGQQKLKGISQADSVILDPHKGLFLPYGLGIVMIKNREYLISANHYEANYMQDTQDYNQEYSPAELSPELSKHFRGMRMWLPLKLYGIEPFKYALEEKIALARYFYIHIKALGFETSLYPDLSIVIFRYIPSKGQANLYNDAMIRFIREDGRIFLSSTLLEGRFMLRLAVLSFRTHLKEIKILLDLLAEYIRTN